MVRKIDIQKKIIMDFSTILDYLKQQGFSIVILCSAIYWFNQKYDNQQIQIDNLNAYIRTTLADKLDANTQAFNEFKVIIKTYEK
jgi:hypothetical protein